jgi:small-conductance mechanosensitive channel
MTQVPPFLQRAFDPPTDWQTLAIAFIVAAIVAWIVSRLVRRIAARGLHVILGDTIAPSSPAVRGPLRLVGAATFVLVLALLVVPIFELAGLHPRVGVRLRTLTIWAFSSGLRVLLIAALAYVLVRACTLFVRRFEHQLNLGTGLDALERAKRAKTLGTVIQNVTTALIIGIAALMILRELRVDIAPVLTTAGIVGLGLALARRRSSVTSSAASFSFSKTRCVSGMSPQSTALLDWSKRSIYGRSCCATSRAPSTSFRTARSTRWRIARKSIRIT